MNKDRAKTPTKQQRKPWIVRTPVDFYLIPMSDRARCLLHILEGIARKRPYCFPGNARLVRMTGKKLRAIQETLQELEDQSWIKRVYAGSSRRNRIGIILLQRIDPEMPAADTADRLRDAEAKLFERGNPHSASVETCTRRARNSAPEEGSTEGGRREEGIKERHHATPLSKRTFSSCRTDACDDANSHPDRDRLEAAAHGLGSLEGPELDSALFRFSSLCLSVLWDDNSNRGCFIDLGRKIAARTIDPDVFVECVDKSILHVGRGEVKHPPGHFMSMLARRTSKEALDEITMDYRSNPEAAARLHNSSPVPLAEGA